MQSSFQQKLFFQLNFHKYPYKISFKPGIFSMTDATPQESTNTKNHSKRMAVPVPTSGKLVGVIFIILYRRLIKNG